jgi:hypothetical protein
MILVCGEALLDFVPVALGNEPAYVARSSVSWTPGGQVNRPALEILGPVRHHRVDVPEEADAVDARHEPVRGPRVPQPSTDRAVRPNAAAPDAETP